MMIRCLIVFVFITTTLVLVTATFTFASIFFNGFLNLYNVLLLLLWLLLYNKHNVWPGSDRHAVD